MQSQNDRILKHLKRRPLTNMHAVTKLGIMCATKRISELRQAGYNIRTEMVPVGKRGVRVAKWRLKEWWA